MTLTSLDLAVVMAVPNDSFDRYSCATRAEGSLIDVDSKGSTVCSDYPGGWSAHSDELYGPEFGIAPMSTTASCVLSSAKASAMPAVADSGASCQVGPQVRRGPRGSLRRVFFEPHSLIVADG